MIILGLSVLAALIIFVLFATFFGAVAAIFPAVVALLVTYFFTAKNIGKKMEHMLLKAQSELQKGRIEQGIQLLEIAKKRFGKWQFFVTGSLNGQIGSIYYMRQEFNKARPYLERSFFRHWVAKAMLGVLHYRKKEYDKMDKAFDHATRYNGKQGLLWSTWAYCHWRLGHIDRAIQILSQGKNKIGDQDPRIQANLLSLQNDKKMKMKAYGEQWYQFHLEESPMMKQAQRGNIRFSRQ